MRIAHKIDDFLETIFPELNNLSKEKVIQLFKDYYSYGAFVPNVEIEGEFIFVDIDIKTIENQDGDYRKVVDFCEKGNYSEAKPILTKLLSKNPTNSEYHRIKGQILSDEGNIDGAIDTLIDALRWDPTNKWALILMGNIFARSKDDIATAMKYYNQALIVSPDDHIAINNLGANLMSQGKTEEAKNFFYKALAINPDYPNTHFALALISQMENDNHSAFYSALKSTRLNTKKDELYEQSLGLVFQICQSIIESDEGMGIAYAYKLKLETECSKDITIIAEDSIPTAAKFEFAENYNRTEHILKYNPNYPAKEHLIMHELVHLDFVTQARNSDLNMLFISDQSHVNSFALKIKPTLAKLTKIGIPEDAIINFTNGLFEGINRQIFNTPIDLFIEKYLFSEYPELRPYQFVSLYNLIQESIKAVTDEKIIDLSPADVLSKSKILNLINALQFNELFGIHTVHLFNPSTSELKIANDLYKEFLEYEKDREPGEEYELVKNWADDLKLDDNFELINEIKFRATRSTDNILESIENDPYGINSIDPNQQREMDKFQKSQAEIGLNMAVVMFMIDALQYFKEMPISEIKKIAMEIALQGTMGYHPEKKDYRINSIKGKLFSGYHILAYYYVSFALGVPEMLNDIQLPFKDEYEMAKNMNV